MRDNSPSQVRFLKARLVCTLAGLLNIIISAPLRGEHFECGHDPEFFAMNLDHCLGLDVDEPDVPDQPQQPDRRSPGDVPPPYRNSTFEPGHDDTPYRRTIHPGHEDEFPFDRPQYPTWSPEVSQAFDPDAAPDFGARWREGTLNVDDFWNVLSPEMRRALVHDYGADAMGEAVRLALASANADPGRPDRPFGGYEFLVLQGHIEENVMHDPKADRQQMAQEALRRILQGSHEALGSQPGWPAFTASFAGGLGGLRTPVFEDSLASFKSTSDRLSDLTVTGPYATQWAISSQSGSVGRSAYPPGDPRQAMMDLAARMDRIATEAQSATMKATYAPVEQFFIGAGPALSNLLVALQRPRGQLGAPVESLLTYLTADHDENNEALYKSALDALDLFKTNPARFFGEHFLDAAMLMSGAGQAAAIAQAEKAALRLENVASEVAALRNAERRMLAEERASGAGSSSSPDNVVLDPETLRLFDEIGIPRPPLNPFWGTKNCVQTSIAQIKHWLTGKKVPANTYHWSEDGTLVYGETKQFDIEAELSRQFGKEAVPVRGGDLALLKARNGIPQHVTLGEAISALQEEGSIAFVQVERRVFRLNGPGVREYSHTEGHAFAARNVGGEIKFWDPQTNRLASLKDVTNIWLYRVR